MDQPGRMILRIARWHLPDGTGPAAILTLRGQLSKAGRAVAGLETAILGVAREGPAQAVLVTVWRDVESMVRATGTDDEDRLLTRLLAIPLTVEGTDHYELVTRTFAALPPETAIYVRIIRIRARPNDEAALIEILRQRQPRLVEMGLIASHLGRRVGDRGVEMVTVGVWPDLAAVSTDGAGDPSGPLFSEELRSWGDGIEVETYDGVEVAPQLASVTGPSLLVIDDELRIVDATAGAAATLGWAPEELIGRRVPDLSVTEPELFEANIARLMRDGQVEAEARWHVPEVGRVFMRLIARRDVPVPGRHAVLVRRHHDPRPTEADFLAAVAEAFPVR